MMMMIISENRLRSKKGEVVCERRKKKRWDFDSQKRGVGLVHLVMADFGRIRIKMGWTER